ncbi:MAG: diacylglycerol kinase family protein, partial [Ilumatobacter sp.]
PTGSGMSIVCNNASGRSSHRKELDVIGREFPDAQVIVVEAGATIDATIAEQVGRARVLGVIGGDGTIGTAAAAAHDADIPLAVFPGGTLNHFARDLGIESMDDAVAAVRSGEVLDVDVGVIDDHLFLNTASFGTYSEFVDAREQYEDRIGKWPAVMVALWRTVLWCKPLEVTIDGEARRVWTIFVGNCAYDPPGFAPATRLRLDDGRFDVRIIDGTHPAARLRLVVAVVTGRVGKSAVYTRRVVEQMDAKVASATVDLSADGEIFVGSGSFSVEKHPRPLKVFAPHA